ncbi:retrovirus-related pol polyprotein from transposon TNT 1-94 [Tanacetum coccineum]
MVIVGFLMPDSPLANRLYLSSTSLTLIVDDEKIPLLMRLNTDDSGVELTKEILLAENTIPKAGTLENLLMWARNQKYDVKIDKLRTKKVWNYPSCRGDKCKKGNLDCKDGQFWCDSCNSSVDYPVIRYRLELEISDETAEVVVVMFDETARVLLKCSASSILDYKEQDEEASLGLPTALANIKVVIGEDVEEDATSTTVVGNDASKASELKRLSKPPTVATPSKPVWICYVREELEDSDAEASFVTDNQPKGGDVACSSDKRKRKREELEDPDTEASFVADSQSKG